MIFLPKWERVLIGDKMFKLNLSSEVGVGRDGIISFLLFIGGGKW